MDYKNTHFPQFRKLRNGLRIYKINSPIEFEELQILGEKVYHFKFVAEKYPEKLRILDMIQDQTENYTLSSSEEWKSIFNQA